VPDYLRTKPVPEAESKHTTVEMRANLANPDTVVVRITANES